MKEITIIGLGGIGSYLVNILSRYMNSKEEETRINLVDGDEYESKNFQRQEFKVGREGQNKASAQRLELEDKFRKINFVDFNEYVNEDNIKKIIKDKQTVFVCVDNHKTRRLISKYADTLQNIDVISGGNEYVDGNVQIYLRKNGVKCTPSITDYHGEIENPVDKSPDEMSCEELSSESAPQLLFTNLSVATFMCWAYYVKEETGKKYEEIPCELCFNMQNMNLHAKQRNPKI